MIRHIAIFFGALAISFAAVAQKLDGVPLITASDYLTSAEEKGQADLPAVSAMRARPDRFSNVRLARFNVNAVYSNIVTVVLPDGTERQYIATKTERIDTEAERNNVIPDRGVTVDPSASANAPAEIAVAQPMPDPPGLVRVAPHTLWTGKSKTGSLTFGTSDDGGFYGEINERINRVQQSYLLRRLPSGLLAVQTFGSTGMKEATPSGAARDSKEQK